MLPYEVRPTCSSPMTLPNLTELINGQIFCSLKTIYKDLRDGLLFLFSQKIQMVLINDISSKSWTKAQSGCIEQTVNLLSL